MAARPAAGSAGGAMAASEIDVLRRLAIAAGIAWSIAFVTVGLCYALETYGDGSMFSYAVAVRDAWAFHWHNISGRVTVFLLTLWPAELYVALSGNPGGGIVVYGLLFYIAPLVGLAATFALDRSKGRLIFAYACASTACLCPLVFGAPTEMWMAHAIFWPALAAGHYAGRTIRGTVLVFVLLLALVLSHEGALVLAAAIIVTLALRGLRDAAFLRGVGALLAALAIWATVKAILPPGDYFAAVYVRAALDFFDLGLLRSGLVLLLVGALAGYAVVLAVLARFTPSRAHIYSAALVALILIIYWLRFDHALHAENRYYMRTALVVLTPPLGLLAALFALRDDGRLNPQVSSRFLQTLSGPMAARTITGAFALLMLMHAVETAKFVKEWTHYKAAVLALADGTAADPALGDPRLVSSARIGAGLNRLSWYSTTPYLSAILTDFAPKRLVVDPRTANYFWLSCATATANAEAKRAVPAATRALVRDFSCLHRR
jgi:hypothetical protein